MSTEVVVVGVSLGGLHALQVLLGALPADFPLPIAVAQHRFSGSDVRLLEVLQSHTPLTLVDPEDKEPLRPGHVYLAPAGYHLLLDRGWCELTVDARVRYARPSAAELFESAADAYGQGVVAVVLTGANADGAGGAAAVKARGGTVIVQEPGSAEAPQMPQAALDACAVDHVVPLEDIAGVLLQLTSATRR